MAHLCTTLNPRDYLLPGVTSGTYVLHAIASVRIYYSAQLTSSNLNHFGALRLGGVGAKRKNNGNQWVYSHLKGTLVFGYNHYCAGVETTIAETTPASNNNNSNNNGEKAEANGGGREWWFQLVDDETDKVVWKFKLPLSPGYKFNYEFDRPFFHVFQGSSRKYGFLFADDRESEVFSSEVITRVKAATTASCTSSKVPIDKGMRFTSRYHHSHAIKGPVT